MHDVAVIIPSWRDGEWLERCVSTLLDHTGELAVDVVVVDIRADDDRTAEIVRERLPGVRLVACENHGFSHANNVGLANVQARYVLFLNPDTETLGGSLEALVERMEADPRIGLLGCTQMDPGGRVYPTMRRRRTAARVLAEALGAERIAPSAGQRILGEDAYAREHRCDWTSGSFMLARAEALASAGWFDERYFLYSEEEDLCARLREAGWEVRHHPGLTILHHFGKSGVVPELEAQLAYSKQQYANVHLGPAARRIHRLAFVVRYALRWCAAAGRGGDAAAARRRAAAAALSATLGRSRPSLGRGAETALRVSGA